MEENSLIIYNKGIIGKLKRLFKLLLSKRTKNKILLLPEPIQIQRTNIKEEIIIPLDQERERIKALQRKFQNKEIEEQDISIQDIEKLKKLYNTQIRDLKNKINRDISETEKYKNEILEIRLKL
jgi:hypothetical protein